MNVDPADSPAVEFTVTNERNHFTVLNGRSPRQQLIVGHDLLAASTVADKKLSVHELVADHLIVNQKFAQFG